MRSSKPNDSYLPPELLQTYLNHVLGDPAALQQSTVAYEARRHALFFSDPGARRLYKQHVAAIVKRRNSITGVPYRDDPTIFAWELINEPRCEVWAAPYCRTWLQSW